jgi:hypothetical protein
VMSIGEYRRYAAECLILASEVRDPVHKAVLVSMAVAWKRLADQGDPLPTTAVAKPPLDGNGVP